MPSLKAALTSIAHRTVGETVAQFPREHQHMGGTGVPRHYRKVSYSQVLKSSPGQSYALTSTSLGKQVIPCEPVRSPDPVGSSDSA